MTSQPDQRSPEQPPLTIAICTYARGPILVNTLNHIIPQAARMGAEILVIDQLFDHPARINDQLGTWDKNNIIHWLRVQTDSLTGKRNIALKNARADIILFIDDDVIIPEGFLSRHVAAYRNENISGLTGQVYHAIDPDNPPPVEHPEWRSREHFIEHKAMETRSFIGCNHSIRREAALNVGGFDERFIASSQCEDFDIADRLADAGYRLWYDPDNWLIHLRAASGGTRASSSTAWPEWTRTANIFLYAFRHGKTHHNRTALLIRALRTGPLRKEIIKRPWRWIHAWYSCIKGMRYGWQFRNKPTRTV